MESKHEDPAVEAELPLWVPALMALSSVVMVLWAITEVSGQYEVSAGPAHMLGFAPALVVFASLLFLAGKAWVAKRFPVAPKSVVIAILLFAMPLAGVLEAFQPGASWGGVVGRDVAALLLKLHQGFAIAGMLLLTGASAFIGWRLMSEALIPNPALATGPLGLGMPATGRTARFGVGEASPAAAETAQRAAAVATLEPPSPALTRRSRVEREAPEPFTSSGTSSSSANSSGTAVLDDAPAAAEEAVRSDADADEGPLRTGDGFLLAGLSMSDDEDALPASYEDDTALAVAEPPARPDPLAGIRAEDSLEPLDETPRLVPARAEAGSSFRPVEETEAAVAVEDEVEDVRPTVGFSYDDDEDDASFGFAGALASQAIGDDDGIDFLPVLAGADLVLETEEADTLEEDAPADELGYEVEDAAEPVALAEPELAEAEALAPAAEDEAELATEAELAEETEAELLEEEAEDEAFDPWASMEAEDAEETDEEELAYAEDELIEEELEADASGEATSELPSQTVSPAAAEDETQGTLFAHRSELADPLYASAVELVVDADRCSVAMLQRHLDVSFSEATALIERMADEGIVGPQLPSGRRKILVTKKQWRGQAENAAEG